MYGEFNKYTFNPNPYLNYLYYLSIFCLIYIYLPIHLPIFLPIHLPIFLSILQSIYLGWKTWYSYAGMAPAKCAGTEWVNVLSVENQLKEEYFCISQIGWLSKEPLLCSSCLIERLKEPFNEFFKGFSKHRTYIWSNRNSK